MQTVTVPKDLPKTEPPKGIVRLLPEDGRLYKINLHTHSTVSDGSYSPAELKALYRAQGYHAVAFTDHRRCVPHPELTDADFVALTGVEVDFSAKDESGYTRKIVHVNALAREARTEMQFAPLPLSDETVNRTIAELNAKNCVVTINHPVFSDMSPEDLLRLHGMHGIEICNSIAVMYNNYSDDSAFFEYFLRAGGHAVPVAADDSHRHFEDGSPFVEYFQSFTVVKAPELTYDALIRGIDGGALFASTGPMFRDLWLEGDTLHAECSPVSSVFVHGKYLSYKTSEIVRGDTLTHVTLDISGLRAISPYIWVQLRDTRGRKAWSVPYWFG